MTATTSFPRDTDGGPVAPAFTWASVLFNWPLWSALVATGLTWGFTT